MDNSKKVMVLYDPVKPIDLKKAVVKNLVMGGMAGIVGATTCYPMDMVKTRMQNQKTLPGAQRMYSNSIDCFRKILAREGAKGLYRGLPAQLVGITPEKAIKLTANDFLRYIFTNKQTGEIKMWHEGLAGSMAGFSQVIVTNPYEIVKVRLQTQSLNLAEGHARKSAVTIVKELGLSGLYRGSAACLLRDVPFSAMYFTLYANLKKELRDYLGVGQNGKLTTLQLFGCSSFAGTIASFAVTPADVVKTRLQVQTSEGSTAYKGIVDAFSRTLKEEGFKALFKGAVPRILIISPLFGITLTVYELLQGYFE
jgi:solute carrier family 25 aspartate/glutamate transporter 12/13